MSEHNYKTIRCILLTKRDGDYTVYAFENLDKGEGPNYVICTRMPNWEVPDIDIYQEGILHYKPVVAGCDTWYQADTGTFQLYKYSANYFIDFVPITHVVQGNTIVSKQQLVMT